MDAVEPAAVSPVRDVAGDRLTRVDREIAGRGAADRLAPIAPPLPLPAPALPRWIAWTGILIAALLFVAESYSLSGAIGSDFAIFHHAAVAFAANRSALYDSASAQSLQGFIYPPPAIVALLPLARFDLGTAFLLYTTAQVVALLFAFALWVGMAGRRRPVRDRIALIALAMASGPVVDLRLGQIDGFILALAVLALHLFRRHPGPAGALLAIGCWVKIYPVLLLAPALAHANRRRLLAGFAAAALAIPALAMTIVPLVHFRGYFLTLLPAMSGRTIVNIYNQSLFAVFARTQTTHVAALTSYDVAIVPGLRRAAIYGAALLGIAAIMWRVRRGAAEGCYVAAWCLATIPLISPLGWGHTYVYALPLALLVILSALDRGQWAAAAMASLGLLVVVIPATHRFGFLEAAPEPVWQLVYARYALLTIAAMALAWWQTGYATGAEAGGKPGTLPRTMPFPAAPTRL